jgi:hypothetical protein
MNLRGGCETEHKSGSVGFKRNVVPRRKREERTKDEGDGQSQQIGRKRA